MVFGVVWVIGVLLAWVGVGLRQEVYGGMVLVGVEVLGEGLVLVVLVGCVLLVVVVLVVPDLVELVEGVVWLARRCLPPTRSAFLWSLTTSWYLSMASDSSGLPNLSLMSRLRNTGDSEGGTSRTSGATYPSPGPPMLSSMLSSDSTRTTLFCSSSSRVTKRGSTGGLPKSSREVSRTRTSSSSLDTFWTSLDLDTSSRSWSEAGPEK